MTALDRLLEDFRDWLEKQQADELLEPLAESDWGSIDSSENQAAERRELERLRVAADGAQADGAQADPALVSSGIREGGWLPLAEALTAVRHDLKLEAKSQRKLAETVTQVRDELLTATARLQQQAASSGRENELAEVRKFAAALGELDDALRRGWRMMKTAQQLSVERVEGQLQQWWEEQLRQARWWQRPLVQRLANGWHQAWRETQAATLEDAWRDYQVGMQVLIERVSQVLQELKLERIDTLGRPVDPTCMKVFEVADPEEGAAETVVQELQAGYRWRGAVVRYAGVRAVRGAT